MAVLAVAVLAMAVLKMAVLAMGVLEMAVLAAAVLAMAAGALSRTGHSPWHPTVFCAAVGLHFLSGPAVPCPALRPEAEALGRSALGSIEETCSPRTATRRGPNGRQRLRRQYVGLLDLLAARAEARGEIDEAVRYFQQRVDAEPYDEQRHVRLANLLASPAPHGSARAALRRAASALSDLGLDPTPSFTSLARRLDTSDAIEMPPGPPVERTGVVKGPR